jgi:hypothetical protein
VVRSADRERSWVSEPQWSGRPPFAGLSLGDPSTSPLPYLILAAGSPCWPLPPCSCIRRSPGPSWPVGLPSVARSQPALRRIAVAGRRRSSGD